MNKLQFPRVGETVCCDTLPNGLTVITLPRKGFRQSCAMLAIRCGGADLRFTSDGAEHTVPAGTAHYLEHKMFDLPDGGNALDLLSARGANANAFTGSDMTAYHFTCTENFYENLDLLLSYVSTPYFTEASVEKERGIISQEIRMGQDSPNHALYEGLTAALYPNHALKDTVAGTVESIAGITADTLHTLHRAFYRPTNMALICVGDVSFDRIASMTNRVYKTLPGRPPVSDYGDPDFAGAVPALVEKPMAVARPIFTLGAKVAPAAGGPALMRQQLAADLAMDCLMGESSPFFNRLYADGLLRRDFGGETDFLANAGIVLVGGESKDPAAVQAALVQALEETARLGLDEKSFLRARRASYAEMLYALEDMESTAAMFARWHFRGADPMAVFDVLPEITPEEGAAFIVGALNPERLCRMEVRPREEE